MTQLCVLRLTIITPDRKKMTVMVKQSIKSVLACTIILLEMILFIPKVSALEIPYFELDESSYPTGGTMIVSLFNFDTSKGGIFGEIIWRDTGNVVFRTKITEDILEIDAPVHPGTYVMRIWQGNEISSNEFSVTGSSKDALVLTGEVLEDETNCIVGVRLKWQNEDGQFQISRVGEDGTIKTCGPAEGGQFIDVNIIANQTYIYTVTDGTEKSNSLVISIGGSVPSETSEDKTFGYIELEVGSPNMFVNGKRALIYADNTAIMPKIVDNRVILPIRSIVEAMEGSVVWNSNTQIVTLINWSKDRKVEIPVGSTTIYVNGQSKVFETAARIEQGRTLVPIRHLEQIGCRVSWCRDTRKVVVRYEQNTTS